ncbi:uncharacterized protein LOC131160592 isoform X2 [Malania oleifera]|uniref:uncharacterized protein LOC131160592 isoform X2 n=1 Tax=Malania oleifera TaxID=397392 RepID=UPI0025AEB8B1|nr:uncharacterized protein LOC131160592 isoform X2 [Malania oleifera]
MANSEEEEQSQLMPKISRVLNETLSSNATHPRKLRDLLTLRSSSSPHKFFTAFSKALTPLFCFHRRTAAAERAIRFVAIFASARDAANVSDCDAFLEDLLQFLLVAAAAANKTARFRACQIISEIIMRLPDDAEVSNELWDEVINCMKKRVEDKIPIIRIFAVRALSRFANDSENSDILELFLEALSLEQNAEVRKTIVLSLPPSNMTSSAVIDCTLDVSESVRKAAYCVLANKLPLQSLSIKLRAVILRRGFADRSSTVRKECLKLLKDEWLEKCCNGDPLELLKYFDVETYELVGESVMGALLKDGLVKVKDGQGIQRFKVLISEGSEGHCNSDSDVQLMEPEVALYWRTVCWHLQTEAQQKGSDAATTMGTEAAVYAAEASSNNELLERILPATVSDYVELVKAHLDAVIVSGPNYRFASRQLLLLGAMLDFSDSTNRKVASAFVQELLHRSLEHEVDDDGNKVVIGDGINLGGDRDWANAVSSLVRKVHATAGEFEEVILGVVEELAQPCRERTADFMQWMHCLAVTGLLLENTKSFRWLQGKAVGPAELLQSLLLTGAKHVHLDVQRVATRCLGLFGLLERSLSEELVKQLRISLVKGQLPVSVVACKALIDLEMWHGPQELERATGQRLSSKHDDDKMAFSPVDFSDADGVVDIELLDLLYAGLDRNDWKKSVDTDENNSVQDVIGEGFAKILLLSENYLSISASLHPLLLAKLISLYFSNETEDMHRLKQCLSVFFEHYPSLSVNHKKCLSKAFILVMRSMWPGIKGNAGGAPIIVSSMRKRAVQASRFMLQMMQAPLYPKESAAEDENSSRELPETLDSTVQPSLESGEEGLAIRIATEVASFPLKKTPAEKSYVIALCKILVLLQFRLSEKGAIKLIWRLLIHITESGLAEKETVKELKGMAVRIRAVDRHPDEELSQDLINLILGRLGIDFNFNVNDSMRVPPITPAPSSTRPARSRRRVRHQDDSDEGSATSVAPTIASAINIRSQRASKTAAMTRMSASRGIRVNDNDDDDDGEESSDVTSEDDSDESDLSV